jgi:hypothetical protein
MSRTTVFGFCALAVLMALVAIAAFHKWQADQVVDRGEAVAWTVAGPPCPQVSAAEFQQLAITPHPFDFEGLSGDMAHGGVSCAEIRFVGERATRPFPVCQFSAPFAVHLDRPGSDVYLKPGVAQPITISLPDGKLRCVLGANLKTWAR